MPSNRRRRRAGRRRTVELDKLSTYIMEAGHDWFNTFADAREATDLIDATTEGTLDRMRAFWEQNGETILADWIETHPGTRPWAWWAFDAPERRQCLNQEHPHDSAEWPDSPHADHELYFGKPRYLATSKCWSAEYETELDYLSRLGLLEYGEAERCEVKGEHGHV